MSDTAEHRRLAAAEARTTNWQRWGPYLSERQWGTVREDYSATNDNWGHFPYEHSLGRAYRWGEDGLLGFTDRECRLCLSAALWNGRDPHLKERLFGLTNPEGNHSEDVKEVYFYLDCTPTTSYARALYKYPQAEFPYAELRAEAKRRTRDDPEFELTDGGAFDRNRYWDVFVEFAKAGPDDLLVRYTVHNRGPDPATLHLLPTLWFRNTWAWGAAYEEGRWAKPTVTRTGDGLTADHETLGTYHLAVADPPAEWLVTENETDPAVYGGTTLGAVGRTLGVTGGGAYKNAFHARVVDGERGAEGRTTGTKAAAVYKLDVPAGGSATVRLRLTAGAAAGFADFDAVVARRQQEADEFYAAVVPPAAAPDERAVARQAYAGLLWSRQFYHYVVPDWLAGDKGHELPEATRQARINRDWRHLFARDVLTTPDKWEYPAFFAWDAAFQCVALARVDPAWAKRDEAAVRPKLPDFHQRTEWFLANRKDALKHVTALEKQGAEPRRRMLLALPTRDRLERTLKRLLDETEFLSPFGVRSLSKVYDDHPYTFRAGDQTFTVKYVPGDMDTRESGRPAAAVPRDVRAVRRRPPLGGPRPVPRVLQRGHRPRPRGQPPDRLDGPGGGADRARRRRDTWWHGLLACADICTG